jgi:hypothetical protein
MKTDQYGVQLAKDVRDNTYIAYIHNAQFAFLHLPKSIGSVREVIGVPKDGKSIEVIQVPVVSFNRGYTKVENTTLPTVAAKLIQSQPKASKAALEHIERILNMDTRGKSTEEIRAEIVRLSEGLPKGHALKAVPAKFADRGAAIAAYTAMRQAVHTTSNEETSMAKTTKTTAAKGKAAAATEDGGADIAPAAAAQKGATKAGTTKAAKAPGKATVVKAAAEAPAKGKGKEAPAATKTAVKKAAKANGVSLEGAFKLSDAALTAKNPEALKLHEGSARYSLMTAAFKKGAKGKITLEDAKAACGDQGKQALKVMTILGYLVPAA